MSSVKKELVAVSNGTYTIRKADRENEYYFYRNDGGVLYDCEDVAMNIYREYVLRKSKENPNFIHNAYSRIYFETSEDERVMKLTVSGLFITPKQFRVPFSERIHDLIERLFY